MMHMKLMLESINYVLLADEDKRRDKSRYMGMQRGMQSFQIRHEIT
jgi:hypothetical protein